MINSLAKKLPYLSKIRKNQITEKLFCNKGEQYHLAVAAASILCRTVFLEELEKASQEVGLQLPSGAGSKSDQVAAQLLQKAECLLLAKYTKLHFANTEKAQKLLATISRQSVDS